MKLFYTILAIAIVPASALFSYALLRLNANNLTSFEKLCRSKAVGIIIGFPLICWCVPHAQVIVFGWAEAYLWYAAIILSVLSYFYLDYLTARAIGGLFIIGAYCFVHAAWDFKFKGAIPLTIISWIWGIIGICISAKPSYLRDFFRKAAVNHKLKFAAHLFLYLSAIVYGFCGLGELLK